MVWTHATPPRLFDRLAHRTIQITYRQSHRSFSMVTSDLAFRALERSNSGSNSYKYKPMHDGHIVATDRLKETMSLKPQTRLLPLSLTNVNYRQAYRQNNLQVHHELGQMQAYRGYAMRYNIRFVLLLQRFIFQGLANTRGCGGHHCFASWGQLIVNFASSQQQFQGTDVALTYH